MKLVSFLKSKHNFLVSVFLLGTLCVPTQLSSRVPNIFLNSVKRVVQQPGFKQTARKVAWGAWGAWVGVGLGSLAGLAREKNGEALLEAVGAQDSVKVAEALDCWNINIDHTQSWRGDYHGGNYWNALDRSRCSMLAWAVFFGNTDIVKQILDAGANPNVIDIEQVNRYINRVRVVEPGQTDRYVNGWRNVIEDEATTVLMQAVKNNNPAMVKLLLDAGADASLTDRRGNKAIDYVLCGKKGTEITRMLDGLPAPEIVEQGKKLEHVIPTQLTSETQLEEVLPAESTLADQTEPAIKSQSGEEIAVTQPFDAEVPADTAPVIPEQPVKQEIEQSAESTEKEEPIRKPRPTFYPVPSMLILPVLLQNSPANSATRAIDQDTEKLVEELIAAIKNRDTARVQDLLASGMPVNQKDRLGNTPLYYAIAYGFVEIARLLLDAGAHL